MSESRLVMCHIPWLACLLQNDEWMFYLRSEFERQDFRVLADNLEKEYQARKTICPPRELIFNAFNLTPLSQVKVVMLGQDPYHDDGQAMGLSFSVPRGKLIPPSLENIFKELERDPQIPGFKKPSHGDLTKWADNGVLLLNTALTVEAHEANSHEKLGWHTFTDTVIQAISWNRDHVVFILMGGFAHKKAALVVKTKHTVIKTTHPSPVGAIRAKIKFAGCACFSQCNKALESKGQTAVDWTL